MCSTCSAWLNSQGLADASLVVAYNAVVKALSVVPFFSGDDAGFEEGEIQASDLTPQGSCFECTVCSFRIMTLRSHTDSLPGAVRESW